MIKKSKKIKISKTSDSVSREGYDYFYSETLLEHFYNPRNFVQKDPKDFDGVGMVGSAACGDIMKIWIKVGKDERIKKCLWRTFGCASAIASTSMLSEMVTEKGGMKIEQALAIKAQDIVERLGGLPAIKFHCSVLGDKALRAAINDYFRRTGQKNRMVDEDARIVDPTVGITDKDIEEAVKRGAKNLKDVQKMTKVGVFDKSCLPEIEELLRFYLEKHQK